MREKGYQRLCAGALLDGVACLSVTAEAQREGLSLRAGTDLGLGWLDTSSNRHIPAFLQAHTCLSKDAGLLFCSHSGWGRALS